MAKATKPSLRRDQGAPQISTNEEDQGLLSGNASDEDDIVIHAGQNGDSIAPKTPRTPNRVRFDLPPQDDGEPNDLPPSYDEPHMHSSSGQGLALSGQQRAPLLPEDGADSTRSWDGDDVDAHHHALRHINRPRSSLRSAMSNMTNSIIGAGIIGQPYAMKQAGLLTGITLLIILTVAVDWTIRLIVINSKLSGRGSFQGTVEHCFGRLGLIAISLAQWAFAFGGMVAYGVIIGDSIPHVLEEVWPGLAEVPVLGILTTRRGVISVFIMGISLPLTLYRDISKLAKASTLALISMAIIVVAVVTQGVSVPDEFRGTFEHRFWTINYGIFQAIGVISFAFVCQHNSLLIYDSLKTPTLDRFSLVTHISTFISFLACLIMALAGFLTFGSKAQGNILNNFPVSNVMINVARFCFGLNMLTTLPLEAFVCREVMFNYWHEGKRPSTILHVAVSTGLVLASMLISLMTCDLGAVFELIGATSACALAYILPPLCYVKLSTRSWKMIPAIACVVFGFVVAAISFVQAVMKLIKNSDSAQCH